MMDCAVVCAAHRLLRDGLSRRRGSDASGARPVAAARFATCAVSRRPDILSRCFRVAIIRSSAARLRVTFAGHAGRSL